MATYEQAAQDLALQPPNPTPIGAVPDLLGTVGRGLVIGATSPMEQLNKLAFNQAGAQDMANLRREMETNEVGDLLPVNTPENQNLLTTFAGSAARAAAPAAAFAYSLPVGLAVGALDTQQRYEDQEAARQAQIAAGLTPDTPEQNPYIEHLKGAALLGGFSAAGRAVQPLLRPALAATPQLLRTPAGILGHTASNLGIDAALRTGEHALTGQPLAPFASAKEAAEAAGGAFAFGLHGGVEQSHRQTALINKLGPDIAAGKPFSAAELKASGLPTPENYEKINIPNLGEYFIPKKPTVLPNASKTAAELAGSTKSPETETATKEAEAAIEEAPVQPTEAGAEPAPYTGPGSLEFRRQEAIDAFNPARDPEAAAPIAADLLRQNLLRQQQIAQQRAAIERQQRLENPEVAPEGEVPPTGEVPPVTTEARAKAEVAGEAAKATEAAKQKTAEERIAEIDKEMDALVEKHGFNEETGELNDTNPADKARFDAISKERVALFNGDESSLGKTPPTPERVPRVPPPVAETPQRGAGVSGDEGVSGERGAKPVPEVSADKRAETIQLLEDAIATKKANGQNVPQSLVDRLGALRGEGKPEPSAVFLDESVPGHPLNSENPVLPLKILPTEAGLRSIDSAAKNIQKKLDKARADQRKAKGAATKATHQDTIDNLNAGLKELGRVEREVQKRIDESKPQAETKTNEESQEPISTTPDNAGTNVQGEQGAGPRPDAGVAAGVESGAANGEAPRSALSPKETAELAANEAEQKRIFGQRKQSKADEARIEELQARRDELLDKSSGRKIGAPQFVELPSGTSIKRITDLIDSGRATMRDLVLELAKNDPIYGDLAKKILRSNAKDLHNVEVARGAKPNKAFYIPATHSARFGRNMDANAAVIEEALHSLTSNRMNRELKVGDLRGEKYIAGLRKALQRKDVSQPVKDLVKLYLDAIEKTGNKELFFGSKNKESSANTQFDAMTPVEYGLSSLDEFVAHGLKTPTFQRALNNIKSPLGGTLLSRFVQTVRKLMGLDPKYDSILSDLIARTDEVLKTPEAGPDKGGEVGASPFKDEGKPLTEEEVRAAADTQRGAPEGAMMEATRKMQAAGAPAFLTHAVEHIGDLAHRAQAYNAIKNVDDKIRQIERTTEKGNMTIEQELDNGYKENAIYYTVKDNPELNELYKSSPRDAWAKAKSEHGPEIEQRIKDAKQVVKEQLAEYTKAHEEENKPVTVLGQLGKYAAIALGKQDFNKLRDITVQMRDWLNKYDEASPEAQKQMYLERAKTPRAIGASPYRDTEAEKPYIDRGQPPVKPLEEGFEYREGGVVPTKTLKPEPGIELFHGTNKPFERLEDIRGFGVHFGDKEAANTIVGNNEKFGNAEGNRIIRARAGLKNPLRMPDIHFDDPYGIAKQLAAQGIISDAQYKSLRESFSGVDEKTSLNSLKKLLQDKGYDSVVYKNEREGSADSYIVFDPEKSLKPEGAGRIESAPNAGRVIAASPFRDDETNPGFYSKLAETIRAKMPQTADVSTIKGILANGGLKAEELKWSGIIPWLEGQKGKVTKQEVQDYLRNEGAVRFEEKVLSDKPSKTYEAMLREGATPEEAAQLSRGAYVEKAPKFNRPDLVLPGGENYREVVLTVPGAKSSDADALRDKIYKEAVAQAESSGGKKWGELSEIEKGVHILNAENKFGYRAPTGQFTSSHFPESGNYVAHMRVNERPDSTGKKGTFIEEIQSDRHQKGRERGYKSERPDTFSRAQENRQKELERAAWESERGNGTFTPEMQRELEDLQRANTVQANAGIPDAPYRKDWGVQMFKRALRDAIAKGQDWVGWTKGDTQAERYDLSKQIDKLGVIQFSDGTFRLDALPRGGVGEERMVGNEIPAEKLADYVGKDMAKRILDDASNQKPGERLSHQYSGLDLKIGGEGMKGFYDTILPNEIGKYVKQWGGRVEEGTTPTVEHADAPWRVIVDGEPTSSHYASREMAERAASKFDADEVEVRNEAGGTPFHKVAITPEMRAAVQGGRQPIFASPFTDASAAERPVLARKSFTDKLTEAFKGNKYGARLLRRLAPGVRDVEDTIVRTIDGKDAESAKAAGMVRDTLNRELPDKKDQSAAYVVLDNGGGRAGDADSTAAENLAFHRLQEQRAFLEETLVNTKSEKAAQEIQDKIASIEENMARLQEPAPTVDEVKARIQTEIDKGQEALENPDIPEERKKVIRENLPHYQHALDNAERLAPAAKLAKRAYDDAYLLRQSVDPTGAYYQDYAGRLYEYNETRGGAQIPPDSLIGGRSGVQRYNKQRSYDTLMDAMIGRENSQGTWEGETPLSLALPDVVANHVKNSNDFVGNESVKSDLSLVRDPQTDEPILLPKLKPGQEAPANYVKVNGPSGEDTWVYKPFADIFKTVWSPDAMANSDLGRVSGKAASILKHGTVLYDVFHPSRLIQIGFFEALADGKFTAAKDRIHDYVTQVVKPAMLNGEHGAMGKFLAQFNVDARDIDRYVEKGIITKETADYLRGEGKLDMKQMREGGLRPQLFADNLWKEAEPFMRKMLSKVHGEFAVDAQAALNKATFERLAPGMMAAVFKWRRAELARQNPEMSSVQLSRQAAKETNERFGNLGKSGPLKSATANSLAQRILLAPNWVISQAMSEARGVAQFGKAVLDATWGRKMPNGQRERVLRLGNSAKFLATTMGSVFALNQLVNMATRGHPTWQNPEDDHKFDAWLPGGKTGFFYSPTTLAAEYSHHFHNYHKFESAGSAIAHIATNKLSPMGQAAKIALTQKNYKGEKLSTLGTIGEVTKALTPIPISVGSAVQPLNPFASPSKSGQLTNNLARTMGVQLDRAPDAVAQAYDSFKKYSTKEKPDFGPSPYRDLKTLVQNESSPEAIKKEVDRLKANGKKMDDIRKSFTAAFHPSGSVIGDINALQAEPRLTAVLANARKQKAAEREYFFKALQSK